MLEKLELLQQGATGEGRAENTILSPIDGTVLERLVSEGDPVVPLTTYQAGTALLTMAPMNEHIAGAARRLVRIADGRIQSS
jgi:HlyD family secretion protein